MNKETNVGDRMSDAGDDIIPVETPVAVEVAAEAPKGKLSVEEALQVQSFFSLVVQSLILVTQQVLKNALVHDGLARGLRECAKALDKRQAHLCVLVETCTEAEYIKLIEALCAEHKINLIKVGDAKVLGSWAGLCKIDREGNPRKIVGCTCVVVKEYGVESEGLHVLLDYFKNR
jgi:small subunit ribosomal protein S12e